MPPMTLPLIGHLTPDFPDQAHLFERLEVSEALQRTGSRNKRTSSELWNYQISLTPELVV